MSSEAIVVIVATVIVAIAACAVFLYYAIQKWRIEKAIRSFDHYDSMGAYSEATVNYLEEGWRHEKTFFPSDAPVNDNSALEDFLSEVK